MKHPRLIVLEDDGRLARQLRELAGEGRWLVRTARTGDAAVSLARAGGPAVLLVRFAPDGDAAAPLAAVADAHRLAPDVPAVAVADAKLPDAERAAWAAAALDLGARCVLFPPLTRPVLEDAVGGLMAAAVRRATGGGGAPAPAGGVIDLADEDGGG